MILPILTYPNPELLKESYSINIVEETHKDLAADMLDTMVASRGVGLAAPQIGQLIRMITLDVPGFMGVMVNPKIVFAKDHISSYEGCLSVPGKFVTLIRFKEIKVNYTDLFNQSHSIMVDNNPLLSRVIQHEIDHLNGKLI
jgi:peptide deformylase